MDMFISSVDFVSIFIKLLLQLCGRLLTQVYKTEIRCIDTFLSVCFSYNCVLLYFHLFTDAAGNPLYLTPDELNEFEQQQ